MAKPSNGLTPQQVNDAQHLDNMTSLQQPSAAEQSPITQNGEVKGDAPISSPPTPNPDNPSLFNEPKNPNNKVVEVESQKTSEDLDKGDISDTPSDQGAKFTEDLKGLSGDAINLTITAQANEQGVPGDKQPELDPGVNKAGGNGGAQALTGGGGGIPRPGQAPAGSPAGASPASPTSPTQPNSPSPSQTVEPPRNVESPPPPPSAPPTLNPITPQAQFIPEKAKPELPKNLAPDAVNDSVTTDEDTAITITVRGNDTDPEGNPLTVTAVTNGAHGTVTIDPDTGNPVYTPNANYNGSDSFTYTISDGNGGTDTATVNVTINAINDNAPVFTNTTDGKYTFTYAENSLATDVLGTVTTTDADIGDSVTYTITAGDPNGYYAINNAGQITLSAAGVAALTNDFEALANTRDLTVRASDGTNGTNITVTLNETNVDDNAPVFTNTTDGKYTFTYAENSLATDVLGTVTTTDADIGDSVTYTITAGDPNGYYAINNAGQITLSAAGVAALTNDFEALANTRDLTVRASDGTNGTNITVTLNETNVDDNAPVFTNTTDGKYTFTYAENSLATDVLGTVTTTDADIGDSVTYTITAGDPNGYYAINNAGQITLSAAGVAALTNDFEALANTRDLTVRASDGTNGTNITVTLNETNVDDNAPVFTNTTDGKYTFTYAENSLATDVLGTVTTTDADIGDSVTYTITAGDPNGYYAINNAGQITLSAAGVAALTNDFEALANTRDLTVRASDGTNGTNITVTLNETNVDDNAPVFTNTTDGKYTFTYAENSLATDVLGTVTTTDADIGDSVTYTITAGDPNGYYAINNAGQITLSAAGVAALTNDFEALANTRDLTVRASDGTNGTNITVTLNETNVDDNAPVFTNTTDGKYTFTYAENSLATDVLGTVTTTDADIGDSVTYTITAGDPNGYYAINNAGQITLSAAGVAALTNDFEALANTRDLTVRASDGTNGTNITVTLNETNVDDNAPVFTNTTDGKYTFTYAENSLATDVLGTVTTTDADIGDSVTYTITAGDPNGYYAINNAGQITLSAAGVAALTNDFEALANTRDLTVRASDGTNGTNITVTLNETNVDDNAPVFTNTTDGKYTFTYAENSLATDVLGTVTTTDADIGDSVTYTITAGDPNGYYAINNAGQITLSAAGVAALTNDFEALANTRDLTVRASDGTNGTNITVTLNETNVDDNAPVFTNTTDGKYTFTYAENSLATDVLGTVTTTDADIGDSVTYTITAGDPNGYYAINNAGQITLSAAGVAALTNDFEALANTRDLTVRASDGTNGTNITVTLNETNVDDNAPVFTNTTDGKYTFTYAENSLATDVLGTVTTTDADIGDSVTYTITAGDPNGYYAINNAGQITLSAAGVAALTNDFEALANTRDLTVRASDGTNGTNITVTLNETNVDDTPTVSVNSVTVTEGTDSYATFTVSLDYASSSAISFTPTLTSGTAAVGTDTGSSASLEYFNGRTWVAVSGPVTLAAGTLSVQIRTAITNDTIYEANEVFTLNTGAITGTVTNAAGTTGTGTIISDDLISGITLKTNAELRVDESSGVNQLSSALTETAPSVGVYGQSLGQSTITYQNLVNDTTEVATKTYKLIANSSSGYYSSDGLLPIQLIANGDGSVIEGKASGNVYFTLTVNKSNGDITFTQFKAIQHTDNLTGDESSSGMLSNALKLEIAYSDALGSQVKYVDVGSIIRIEDSSPEAVTVGTTTSSKAADGVTTCSGSLTAGAGTSVINFGSDGIGSDTASLIISRVTGVIQPVGAQTGTSSISNVILTAQDSTPSDGVVRYDYSFDYQVPGSTYIQNGKGTITLSGSQYTITVPKIVDSVAYSTDNLSGITQTNYDLTGSKSPEIVVLSGSSNFSQVITGFSGSQGSNTDTLRITNGVLSNTNQNYLNVSTSTLGVGDDTIQPDDLFNIDFYKTNPVTNNVISTGTEKSFVTNSVITIDQWGSGEDIAINLKLGKIDTNGALLTANKFLVANSESDYVLSGSFRNVSITKDAYSNFYDQGYRIIGMQIVTNTGDIVTTAYSLSNPNGSPVVLGSTGTNYQNTKDADIIKIIKIATVQEVTVPNILKLNIEGYIVDADGDKSQTFVIGTVQSAAPIALDLNADGVLYLSKDAGVTYDFNGDGVAESTAWVSGEDGLLANQRADGSLNVVFSTQAGETDLQGLAKVYDTNHDNAFDAQDAGFNQFGVWQDADSDGVVDAGEFLSLADRGIISLSLTSDGVIHTAADGDVTIYGQTTYTMTDGSTGIAEDVAFAVSSIATDGDGIQDIYQVASVSDAPIIVDHFSADDRDRIDLSSILNPTNSVQSTISIDTDGSTSTHSTITVNIGGVDYEVATLYGKDIGVEDALGTHPGGASLTDSLNGASWTDVVDISSEHGGPASIFADGGSLTNSYSNEAGDWTVQIKSGTATVDALNKQITFSSDNAENLAIITTADGTSHEIANVDKILWH